MLCAPKSYGELAKLWGVTAPAAFKRVKKLGYAQAMVRFGYGVPAPHSVTRPAPQSREQISQEAWDKRNAFIRWCMTDHGYIRANMWPERWTPGATEWEVTAALHEAG